MVVSFLVLGAALVVFLYAVLLYNALVQLKHNVAQAWSNIDVLLKQRHEEPPKLIRTHQLLRAWKRDQPALHARFDLNADGRIDEREWWLARRAARREVKRLHEESLAQTAEGVNLVTSTRDPNRPFIISAYPQREVLRRYYWRAAAYGLAFFASGSTATWLIAVRFA